MEWFVFMAPSGFETSEACIIAILRGMEVGLTPLFALQRLAVIGGRPTIWGDGATTRARPVAVRVYQPADVLAFIDDDPSCALDPVSLVEIQEEIAATRQLRTTDCKAQSNCCGPT